eukprot:TRINITY_DN7145_c0_g1_i2.p1 TRINITY_DN7145_c0_g1~~TRINITY_DN7145_c0_g1_i2.p1  ORF type:complete len:401 (+),score=102.25 TRINITY_DN7145_c0_g1_i2:80-1282(+)
MEATTHAGEASSEHEKSDGSLVSREKKPKPEKKHKKEQQRRSSKRRRSSAEADAETNVRQPSLTELRRQPSQTDDEPICPICLGEFSNQCLLDQCFHRFCFECAVQWSKMSTTCPLCKRPFDSLIHDVRSEVEYKRHFVERPAAKPKPTVPPGRSVVVVDDPVRDFMQASASRPRQQQRRPSDDTTSAAGAARALRRAVYLRRLRAVPFAQSPSVPMFTVRALRQAPAHWQQRLRPWLTRELEAVLDEADVDVLVVFLISLLQQHELGSAEVQRELRDIVYDYAPAFTHELAVYANSPYDLASYDRLVQYDYSNARPTMRRAASDGPPPAPAPVASSREPIELDSDSDGESVAVWPSVPPPPFRTASGMLPPSDAESAPALPLGAESDPSPSCSLPSRPD